jgi:hypothetical protein
MTLGTSILGHGVNGIQMDSPGKSFPHISGLGFQARHSPRDLQGVAQYDTATEMRKHSNYICRLFTFFWLDLIVTGCSNPEPWFIDIKYSEFLSVLSTKYRAISGNDVPSTVGVVQIFSGSDQKDVTSFSAIARGQLLFESREPKVIDRLLSSMQAKESEANAGCDLRSNADWIFVAYDTTLKRIGVISLYKCGSETTRLVGIRPVGDAAITYSRTTGAVLRSLGLMHP